MKKFMTRKLIQFQTYFIPFREICAKLTPRTWVVGIQGVIVTALSVRLFGVDPEWRIPVIGTYITLCLLSIWLDFRRPRTNVPWVLLVACAWIVVIAASHIVSVSKFHLDEALFTESALESIRTGINPYARSYAGTLVDTWVWLPSLGPVHPGIEHYVYFPLNLVLSMPLYLSLQTLGLPYDQRYLYFLAFLGIIVLLWRMLRESPNREALVLAIILSPFLGYLLYTYNDLTALFFLTATAFAAIRRRPFLAAAMFGLTLAAKQFMLITLPFLLLPLLMIGKEKRQGSAATLGVILLSFLVVIGPFAVWSPKDFFSDTVLFFLSDKYPVTGVGFSGLLLDSGVVERTDSFPFWIFQLTISLPVLAILWQWSRRSRSLDRIFIAMGLGIGSVWFFARYFMPAHVTTVVMILFLSYVVREAERVRRAT